MTIDRESFWAVVYEPFMRRELTRQDLRKLIIRGLQQTRGNYKSLVQLFNVDATDCKRFLSFLHKHEGPMPVQKFRSVPGSAASVNGRARRARSRKRVETPATSEFTPSHTPYRHSRRRM
jgi:hypothetical protein